MKSKYVEKDFAACATDLDRRVYTSRLLGQDKALILHGGGNTSVKTSQKNAFGEEEEVLLVKGSGWDLEKIEPEGFSPVKLAHLKRLSTLPALPDPAMVNEMVTHMTRASAPVPSVEAILHAILPFKYVDHTHADALLTVSNSVDGEQRIRAIYGDSVVVIPYVMPGFDLARVCAKEFALQSHPATIGMVLLNHGIFSFGQTAQESYERMIDLVGRAEDYLRAQGAWDVEHPSQTAPDAALGLELAALRQELSSVAGFPVVMVRHADSKSLAFAQRQDLPTIAQQGPAYAGSYRTYFEQHEPLAKERKRMLDVAPRVVLDPQLGMCALGRSAKDAAVVAEIYSHTMDVIARATLLGGYRALPTQDIFDVEYWDLEQAKLKKGGKPAAFAGEIALVTGAASGIGKACVDALLARGAAVVGLDLNPSITGMYQRPDFLGIACDVGSEDQLRNALQRTADAFGGLDMLVLNAGIFPTGCRVESLASDQWRRVMQINLDANFHLMREAHPYLKLALRGGRMVIIGSKNVPAPGPGAAAYSASKAALNQLARVAALEWGADGIRVNSVHPNAVFDTGLWTEEVLASRAQYYGLSVDAYKKNNVLGVEVSSRDVAELAAEMCGPLFAKTTGSQVPVDGGNDRVI